MPRPLAPVRACAGERAELHMAMPLLEAAVDSRKGEVR